MEYPRRSRRKLLSYIGALLQLDYNSLGINSATLSRVGFPGGNVNVFSATVNPIVHLTDQNGEVSFSRRLATIAYPQAMAIQIMFGYLSFSVVDPNSNDFSLSY